VNTGAKADAHAAAQTEAKADAKAPLRGPQGLSRVARILPCVRTEVRLQLRYGLYTVYAIVCAVYILILRALSPDARRLVLPVLVFLDPTMLGFFFVGGMVLFELGDRTLTSLFTSPLRITEYFAAKILSLGLLAVLASLTVATAGAGMSYRPLLLTASVLPTAAVFTLIGLAAVSRFRTVNAYLLASALYMLPFAVPLLDYFGVVGSPLLYLLPSQGALDLIAASFRPAAPRAAEWAPAAGSLAVWLVLSWLWAGRWFRRYVIRRIGEEE